MITPKDVHTMAERAVNHAQEYAQNVAGEQIRLVYSSETTLCQQIALSEDVFVERGVNERSDDVAEERHSLHRPVNAVLNKSLHDSPNDSLNTRVTDTLNNSSDVLSHAPHQPSTGQCVQQSMMSSNSNSHSAHCGEHFDTAHIVGRESAHSCVTGVVPPTPCDVAHNSRLYSEQHIERITSENSADSTEAYEEYVVSDVQKFPKFSAQFNVFVSQETRNSGISIFDDVIDAARATTTRLALTSEITTTTTTTRSITTKPVESSDLPNDEARLARSSAPLEFPVCGMTESSPPTEHESSQFTHDTAMQCSPDANNYAHGSSVQEIEKIHKRIRQKLVIPTPAVMPARRTNTDLPTTFASLNIRDYPVVREYSAGGLIFNEYNEVAIIGRYSHAGNLEWCLPKGHIEKGETSEDAAIREVFEETGILGEIVGSIATIDYWFVGSAQRIHKLVHHYVLRRLSGELTVEGDPDHEAAEVMWVHVDDLNDVLSYPNERRVVWLYTRKYKR